ncbi:MAG: DEAD/DEAH box helicase family protein [Acidobacteria bacterium]|nr:DEAD/DEAH box helicase family protein [Acidobacteriota bacterium]
MKLKLEQLEYQQTAIQSVAKVFEGTAKNSFDNATFEGIRTNLCQLTARRMLENINRIATENGISEAHAKIAEGNDVCVEMETGTGKTLVYLKTIYELHKQYGFTKFLILVPSVAIRQGVLGTLRTFEKQLESVYGFRPNYFEYDSKKLSRVKSFAEEQHPQIMIATTAAIVGDDKIINREQREDLFDNTPYIDVLARTRPVIIMDEPQEGMDADKTKEFINRLRPLAKLRYSATHREVRNLVYRLTPYDSYRQNLVKKIEVLTVTEKNDEATIKIELAGVQTGKGDPKVKLNAWKLQSNGYVFGPTNWLVEKDNLGDKTKNPSYTNYSLERIYKSLQDGKWRVKFTNGAEVLEKQAAGDVEGIWAMQLEWLIHRHFAKSAKLRPQGIKCLSLVFIDRVANYMGDRPKIKNLFVDKYRAVYPQYHDGSLPTEQHIADAQGFYFARAGKGEFTDSESSMRSNKEIYELILQKKDELLTLGNTVEFIFSHTALGVGWDNPNVFNIATLNTTFSETRKRQEIGRGLRICVNQNGERVYDRVAVSDEERINELTVIPNETSETFIAQYQQEIKEIYGDAKAGAVLKITHKGERKNEVAVKRNPSQTIDAAFRRFWQSLARKADYIVVFPDEQIDLVNAAVEKINRITIPDNIIEATSQKIRELAEDSVVKDYSGSDTKRQASVFSPLDLIEELSKTTLLSCRTIIDIVKRIANHDQFVKNPPRFLFEAANIIRQCELDAALRGLEYHTANESFPLDFHGFVNVAVEGSFVETPQRGVFDKMLVESGIEEKFMLAADSDERIICFLKLPAFYKIKTPVGDYEPDFGLVVRRRDMRDGEERGEYYFVVETKGTNSLEDRRALKEREIYKIECAVKHFEALGVDVRYEAPVKEYETFKTRAEDFINKVAG